MTENIAGSGTIERNAPTRHEAFQAFSKIGILSFGGPAAQISLMHRVLVDERRWIAPGRRSSSGTTAGNTIRIPMSFFKSSTGLMLKLYLSDSQYLDRVSGIGRKFLAKPGDGLSI